MVRLKLVLCGPVQLVGGAAPDQRKRRENGRVPGSGIPRIAKAVGAAFALVFVLALWPFGRAAQAQDWPEFLGPQGTARSNDSVPTTWDDSNQILWKADLRGPGSSSPIVVGDRLVLTCYVNSDSKLERQVLCFDKRTGERLWTARYPADYSEDPYRGYITEHGYASNTPVSDGDHVFVFFGKGGVHCLSMEGEKKWSVDVGKGSSNRQWGSAASPILFRDMVIVNASDESQSIVALDKATGKEVWKQQARMLELTYGTPRIVEVENGRHEIVISVPGEMWGLDPESGQLNWFCETPMTGNICPSVIVDGAKVYSFGGFRSAGSIAVVAGGEDDVTDSNVIWTSRSSSYVATPLLVEDRLYWIDDRGIAHCISAKDGESVYRQRVSGMAGGRPVYASPVKAGPYIYVVTRRSGTFVYEPGDSFQPVAQNRIAGDESDFNATPAISEGRLYLRSNQALYCIGEK